MVETNGDLEAVDSRSLVSRRRAFRPSVFGNTFDEVAHHTGVKARQLGLDALCQTCRDVTS